MNTLPKVENGGIKLDIIRDKVKIATILRNIKINSIL